MIGLINSLIDNIGNKSSESEWDARTVADAGNSAYYDGKADTYSYLVGTLENLKDFVEMNSDDDASYQDFYIEGMIDSAGFFVRSLQRIVDKLREGTDYVPKNEQE